MVRASDKQPLGDITSQLEQVFGVSSVPVSHGVGVVGGSPMKESIYQSEERRRDRTYDDRISNL